MPSTPRLPKGGRRKEKHMSNQEDLKEEIKKQEKGELLTIKPAEKCEHQFRRMRSDEIECVKCNVGYPIQSFYEVKEGHVYIHGTRVI